MNRNLETISKEYFPLTDKGKFVNNNPNQVGHNYWEIYDILFGELEESEVSLLEFGFGANGHCLETFAEFFINSKDIIGVDYNQKFLDLKFKSAKIETFYADQHSEESLRSLSESLSEKKFDIIIDDGAHTPESIRNCFMYFYDLIKDGGYYIIEDSYMLVEQMKEDVMNIISELQLATSHGNKYTWEPIKEKVECVTMRRGLVIIKKGNHITNL